MAILQSVFTFPSLLLILILLRHSTCPVCRKRLGAQEKENEDEEEEAANDDEDQEEGEVDSDEEESDTGSTSDEEVLHINVI